jgi:hypothetical protein
MATGGSGTSRFVDFVMEPAGRRLIVVALGNVEEGQTDAIAGSEPPQGRR